MTSAAGRGDRGGLRRRAGRGVGRVEVRRLGRELGGARVDHRVARPQPERRRAARTSPRPSPASAASSRSPKPARLAVARSVGRVRVGRVGQPRGRRRARLGLERRRSGPSRRGTTARSRWPAGSTASGTPAAEQAEEPPQPRVGRLEELAQHDRRGRPLGEAGRSRTPRRDSSIQRIRLVARRRRRSPRVHRRRDSRTSAVQDGSSASGPAPACSRPRSALLSAAPNVRSIAMTSPVAFIWVPSGGRRTGTCRTGSAAA